MALSIQIDDLTGDKVIGLLQAHLDFAIECTPPGSVHALDIAALRKPEFTFWTAWEGEELLGCVAIKELDQGHGEIKSMHTVKAARGKGVASMLLENLIRVAQKRGYKRLSLETGSFEAFKPARELYLRFGFEPCPPFADYIEDPNSQCMTKILTR